MQRVFFSFHVPEPMGEALLKNLRQQVSFSLYSKENLHITLQFVGDATNKQVEQLKAMGEKVSQQYEPIQITPSSFFMEQGRLRLAIKKEPMLFNIQKRLTEGIETVDGIIIKQQEYTPHITLGRPPENFSLSSLSLSTADFAFPATSFGLYKSEPGENNMGAYTLLQEFQIKSVEESETHIQAIMLPARPQPDTIVAMFFLRTFGQERYPDIERAEILVRPTPPEGANESSLLKQRILPIDIVGGKFDHHKQGKTASLLVAKDLGIDQSPSLAKLLAYAERDDKYGKGTVSQDPLDKAFGLSGLIAALNKAVPNNPKEVVEYIIPLLVAHYIEEKKRAEDLPREFQEKLAVGKATVLEAKHKKKKVKIISIESDEPSMPGWLRSSIGQKADIVIQRMSSGNTNILTRPLKKIDLRKVTSLVRTEELRLSKSNIRVTPVLLSQPGRMEGLQEWYYDRATNSLLNGGVHPAGTPPTRISLDSITKLILQGLETLS